MHFACIFATRYMTSFISAGDGDPCKAPRRPPLLAAGLVHPQLRAQRPVDVGDPDLPVLRLRALPPGHLGGLRPGGEPLRPAGGLEAPGGVLVRGVRLHTRGDRGMVLPVLRSDPRRPEFPITAL